MEYVNKKSDGYMTLEATLLFPIIFTAIIWCMYLGFFMYDRCLLENSAYIAALKGSRYEADTNDEVYLYTLEKAQGLIEKRVFAASHVKMEVEVSFDTVTVSYEATVTPPIGSLCMKLLDRNPLQIKGSKQAKRIRTTTTLRGFRKIEKMVLKEDR